MPDSNRSGHDQAVGAIVAVLVTAGLLFAVWQAATLSEKYTQQSEQAARKYADRTEERIRSTCLNTEVGAFVKCVDEIVKTSQEAQTAQRDLAAQNHMAFWAFAMFWPAAGSLLLTAIGVFMIWRTLVYTAVAAQYSKEMAVSATEATKAARQQADIAERSQRPYVIPSGVQRVTQVGSNDDAKAAVVYSLGNFGSTPAIIHYVDSTFGSAPTGHPGEPGSGVTKFDHNEFNSGDILPAETMHEGTQRAYLPAVVLVKRDARNRVTLSINGLPDVYLAIHVKFEDMAGTIRKRRFTWRYDQYRQRFLRYGGQECNYEREYKRETLPT